MCVQKISPSRSPGDAPRVVSESGPGFVVDSKPDLQVALVDGAPAPGDGGSGALYLGSQDVAADLDLLKGSGITHVLNVGVGESRRRAGKTACPEEVVLTRCP